MRRGGELSKDVEDFAEFKVFAEFVDFEDFKVAAPTPQGSCTPFSVLCTLQLEGRMSASFPARLVRWQTLLKYASESFSFGGAQR